MVEPRMTASRFALQALIVFLIVSVGVVVLEIFEQSGWITGLTESAARLGLWCLLLGAITINMRRNRSSPPGIWYAVLFMTLCVTFGLALQVVRDVEALAHVPLIGGSGSFNHLLEKIAFSGTCCGIVLLSFLLLSSVERVSEELKEANERLRKEAIERTSAEETLRRNEQRLKAALNATKTSCWDVNLTTGELVSTRPSVDWLGYPPEEIPSSRNWWKSLIHPDDVEVSLEALADHLEGRAEYYECEYRVRSRSGAWCWSLDRGMVVERDENGAPARIVGTDTDITESRQAKQELEQANRELRREIANREHIEKRETQLGRIVEESLDEIFIFDAQTLRFLYVNRGGRENIGYSMDELSVLTPLDLKPELTLKTFTEITAPLVNGEQNRVEFETVHRRKDESQFNIEAHLQLAELDNKLVFVAHIRDITDRERAAEELRDSESRMRTMLESSPVCIKIVDLDSRLQYMSAAGRNQLKISDVRPYYGRTFPPELYPESMRAIATEHLNRAKEGEASTVECCILDTAGGELWYDTTFAPARNTEDQIEHVMVTSVNITERKQAEEALRKSNSHLGETLTKLTETQEQVIQQERLRALGQMASGVAHDLNNTLSPIVSFTEIVLMNDELSTEMRRHLEHVQTAAWDAAAVVKRLRDFHDPRSKEGIVTVAVNLKELVAQIPELTRPRWRDDAQRTGRDIQFKLDLDGEPFVNGPPSELREVFVNLVFNAVGALPSGGKITLRLRRTAECAVVEVIDTGIGMTAEIAAHCFEPFFTAMGPEGTGLGLSVCHGIVERHGGRFEIDTAVGHGTTMRVLLPLSVQDERCAPERETADVLPSHRVLYIDDDPRLRTLVAMLLKQLGQQVDVAPGGAAGVEMFQANHYDVVITDLGMPEIDGLEVTRIVKATRHKLPVIMLTGWGSEFRPEQYDVGVEPDQLMAKPLTLTKLREALELAFA